MKNFANHLGLLCFYTIVALLCTYPLLTNFYTAIPGHGGDGYVFLWNYWWFKKALLDSRLSLFFTDYSLFPVGIDLSLHSFVPLNCAFLLVLEPFLGVIGGFNTIYLTSIVLSAYGMYTLTKYTTGSQEGAILSGLAYSLSPYFFAHSLGHFNLTNVHWFPFAIYFMFKLKERQSYRNMIMLSILFVAIGYTDYNYLIFIFSFAALFLTYEIVHMSVRIRKRDLSHLFKKITAIVLFLAGVASLSFYWLIDTYRGFYILIPRIKIGSGVTKETLQSDPFLFMFSSINTPLSAFWIILFLLFLLFYKISITCKCTYGSSEKKLLVCYLKSVSLFLLAFSPIIYNGLLLITSGNYKAPSFSWFGGLRGADLISFFHPSFLHSFLGDEMSTLYKTFAIKKFLPMSESVVYLGLLPIILVTANGIWRVKERAQKFWVFTFMVYLVLSLGPFLLVAGHITLLPLPYTILRFMPILNNVRVPSRFAILAFLALILLMAFAIKKMYSTYSHKKKVALTIIMGCVILIEFSSFPIATKKVEIPVYYKKMGQEQGDFSILELPLYLRDGLNLLGTNNSKSMYYQTAHNKKIFNGYFSRIPDRTFTFFQDNLFFNSILKVQKGESVDEKTISALKDMSQELVNKYKLQYINIFAQTYSNQFSIFLNKIFILEKVEQDSSHTLYRVIGT